MARNKTIPQLLALVLRQSSPTHELTACCFRILKTVGHTIQLSFQKGELYESLSSLYFKHGVFTLMMERLPCLTELGNETLLSIVRAIEFVSITAEGLELIFEFTQPTVDVIARCFLLNRF